MRRFRLWVPLIAMVLAGCETTGNYVPVQTAGEQPGARLYVVRKGDTLYSIAFRFGLDYKALARANNISPPYTIYIDQRLRLAEAQGAGGEPPKPPPRKTPPRKTPPRKTPKPIETPQVTDSSIAWRWPYEGEVVGRFSLSGKVNKGIDIRGKSGDEVRSSADGIVVYAGGGLRGYGKLVIVKHNDRYLSAYGHNQTILVKEGDKVRAGQVVARIGGPGGNEDLLHFEIRRDGKPRDPMAYLPPRT